MDSPLGKKRLTSPIITHILIAGWSEAWETVFPTVVIFEFQPVETASDHLCNVI